MKCEWCLHEHAVIELTAIATSYDAAQSSGEMEGIEPPRTWKVGEISHWLARAAAAVHNGESVDINADLLEQGFDRYPNKWLTPPFSR
jgi:hypothetical protein